MTPLRAVVLDFDGLVLDTESTWFAVWQAVFAAHGHTYAIEDFHKIVGAENGANDPRRVLEARIGRPLNWDVLNPQLSADGQAMNRRLSPMPGVVALLHAAHQLGCSCAIASSSRHDWVDRHLQRLSLFEQFDVIVCRDDVASAKPDPDLYQEVTRRLAVEPQEALALEDSFNGTVAAKRAGVRCVAVPGPMTQTQDFSAADVVLSSLANVDLADLWARVHGGTHPSRFRQ